MRVRSYLSELSVVVVVPLVYRVELAVDVCVELLVDVVDVVLGDPGPPVTVNRPE